MRNKRILVVDDSSLYQRLLSDVINAHDGLEVVGVASNGKIALSMMKEAKPDLVTLDILMPEMDGIQTLIELCKAWPSVKSIMVSSLTSKGSDAALDALALGASEYAVKPGSSGGVSNIRDELATDLIPKIQELCGVGVKSESKASYSHRSINHGVVSPVISTPAPKAAASHALHGIEIVAIGVSTGGPDALATLLSQLPDSINVPIVIVQHMPAEFTAKLARRLDGVSSLKVVEAQLGDKIQAGTVYIAPGDFHMVLDKSGEDVFVHLNRDEPENSCRPAVDPLFRSIPAIYGDHCLGVILTGMGSDGLIGCEILASAGCPIIVQDRVSSVVWGMPKLVAMAGLAQQQVPLDQMARVVAQFVDAASRMQNGVSANAGTYQQTTISGSHS